MRSWIRICATAPVSTRTGFTAVAVAALAIGIGANTAIFSVVNTILIRPLPYQDPDRLAVIWEHNLPRDRKNNVVSPGNFIHWREMQQSFVDLAAVGACRATVQGHAHRQRRTGGSADAVVSALLPAAGVQPALGRVFTPEEDRPQSRVVVLSDRFVEAPLRRRSDILQKTITVQGNAYAVVGVMPPGFSYLDKAVEIWLPVGFSAQSRTPRGRWLTVMGRLKPGVTFESAQQDMERVHADSGDSFQSSTPAGRRASFR